MTHRATILSYRSFLKDIVAAAEDGSLSATIKAVDAAAELNNLELNSTTFRKLVQDHKVGLFVAKAFTTCAQKDHLSNVTHAASVGLRHFLAQTFTFAWHGRAPVRNSSGALAGSLAAAVSKQLQDSGLLQQLPRTMTAVAQQLEGYAAHPDGAAAGWQAANQPGPFSPALQVCMPSALEEIQEHARSLVHSFRLLTWLCDSDHVQQLITAGAPAAARLSMLLLRSVSAAIQLYDPLSPTAWLSICDLQCIADTVQRLHGAVLGWVREGLGCDPSIQEDMHVYQLNIAFAAANALKLQADCTKVSAGSGATGNSSSSSGAGRRSSRARSSSSGTANSRTAGGRRAAAQLPVSPQQVSNPALQEGAKDNRTPSWDTDADWESASRAWQHASELASSLTPMQQQLFRQLGVDARVLLLVLEDAPQECISNGVNRATLHKILFTARASEARRQSQPSAQQQPRQQQRRQQQQGQHQQHGQPDWPLKFCLNLLLQCTVLPGILAQLRLAPTSKDHDDRPFLFLYNSLDTIQHLPVDLDTAVQALHAAGPSTGLQGFPLQACLKELLHNLLLLPKPLAALRQQQQQQAGAGATAPGSSNSSSSTSSGGSAAGIHGAEIAGKAPASILLLAMIFSLFPEACGKAAGPAAAAAFAGVGVMDGQQDAQQQLQQEESIVEVLRCQSAEFIASLDSCVRVIAAASTSTGPLGRLCANLMMSGLIACTSLFDSQHGVQLLFQPALLAGPGSQQYRQLYSLLASMLKCIGSNADTGRSSSSSNVQVQAVLRAKARIAVLRAAQSPIAWVRVGKEQSFGPGATEAAASRPHPSVAAFITHFLPSLVLIGRVFLQWSQELEQQAQAATRQGGTLMPLGASSAARVCGGGFEPLLDDEPGDTFESLPPDDPDDTIHLADVLRDVQRWLDMDLVSTGLADAGYNLQELQQQLGLLRKASTSAAAILQQPWTEALQPLMQQLQVVGAALSNLAVPNFCNNSSCSNVSGPTELRLVSGRSCICGGCRTARYCSKACQRQHWRHHKPVCQAVAAAAAAAPAPTAV